jgi:hypothetical protein
MELSQHIVLHRREIVGVVCQAASSLAALVAGVLRRSIDRRPSHAVEGGAKVGETRTDRSCRRLVGRQRFLGRHRGRRSRSDRRTGGFIDREIEISVGLTFLSNHYHPPLLSLEFMTRTHPPGSRMGAP